MRSQSSVRRCLRIILGISLLERKRNTSIRKMGRQQRISSILTERRLRFLGHLSRMSESRLPKKLLVCAPVAGKRQAGGQKMRWNDLVQRDLKLCCLESDWRESVQNRLGWRSEGKICV